MSVKEVLFFISYRILMSVAVITLLGIVGAVCALAILNFGWWGLLVPGFFVVLVTATITHPY